MEQIVSASTDLLEELVGKVVGYNPQADAPLIRRAYDDGPRLVGDAAEYLAAGLLRAQAHDGRQQNGGEAQQRKASFHFRRSP